MFKRVFGSLLALLVSVALQGQTREWNQVAVSDGSLPSTLSLGQVVERNPGGRGALVSWMDSSSSNIIVGLNDGTLRKLVYSLGSVTPTVTTPVINGWPGGAYKIRSLHRAPNGTLFMTATTAAEGVWNGSGQTSYNPTPYYTGVVWVSVDEGASWTSVTATGTFSNAGYVGLYPAWASGSTGGYAGRIGGAGITAYDIMEFVDSASASAYGGARTITQSGITRYFGRRSVGTSTVGEPVMNSGGVVAWPMVFTSAAVSWGSNAGCSGGPYYTELRGNSVSWFGNANVSGIWWGKSCSDSVKTFQNNIGQDYAYWWNQEYNANGGTACNTVGGSPGSNPTCSGYNYIWTVGNNTSNTNNRREKLVATFDNSGLVLRASYLNDNGYSVNGIGGNTDGVIVYRGSASGGTAPSVIMGGGNNTDSYSHGWLAYPQESYAAHQGFMAVVAADTVSSQANIYVSENTPAFAGNQNLIQTSFGTTNTSRVMITGANALNPASSGSDLVAWNGKLLAVAQDGWALGTPTATRLAVFTVPSVPAVTAYADGSAALGGTASGCTVVLQGTVTGEPGATVYWWWQQANGSGQFPAITSLGAPSGSSTFDTNGNLSLSPANGRAYTCPSSGSYRLVVAGVLGGFVYDLTANTAPNGSPSNASFGVATTAAQVALQTAPTLTTPLILVNGAQAGTTSATVCGGDSVQVSVVMNGSGTVTWAKNGTAAGTGSSLYISATNSGTTNIVDTYVASVSGTCSGSSTQTFTITTQPEIGAVTVARTVSGTGQPDTAGGCSGAAVVFSASATAASNWTWLESVDNNAFTPTASGSSSFTIPRLASGPALNPNPSFEAGITGWTTGSWLAVTPPGGAANGSNSLNGTNAQTIVSNGYILVDSTQSYLFAAISKNAAQAGTQMSLVVQCFDQSKGALANISLSAATLTSSWTAYGSFIGSGTAYPFPASTAWVKLVVLMPASAAPGAYLDAVRLIPVTASEMAQVNAYAFGVNQWKYAQYWDLRAGSTASGTDSASFFYRASASNACQSAISASQEVRSEPRVWFTNHDIQLSDGSSVMMPDASPANPLVANICGANIVTLFAPATASGTIGFLWQTCTDYAGVGTGSWSAVQGNSQGSSFQMVTNGSTTGATTFYRLVATGGCDGLPYYSRVFKIVEAPAPAVTAPLSGPTTGCSRQVITMGVGYVNGTPTWEQSVDGGAWGAASPVPTLASQSGSNRTYQVQLLAVTGSSARTIAYRIRMNATGCTEVVSTLQGILVNPEATLMGGMVQGFTGSTGTFCHGTTVQLGVVYTPGSSTVTWTDGGGNTVGTGSSFTFVTNNQTNANIISTYRATVSASCGSPVFQDFTITTTPGLGTLSVTRTNSVGGTDGVTGCSGDQTNFAASALAATAFQWQESPDGSAWNSVGSASTLSIPRLASGPALNANPSFEGGNTGWETGSWDAVTPPAPGAANGLLAMNGTTAQDIRTATFTLVDSSKPYLYAAVTRNGAQAGTTATLILECYNYQKTATTPASISLSSTVMTSTWTTFGAFVGAGTSYAFPAGTAYVKLRVSMPASANPGAYLDAVRIIPVTSTDLAQVLANAPSGDSNRFAQYWDLRTGLDATGTDNKTWSYLVTASNACGTATSNRLDQTTSPKVFFTNHDISMNNVSIAVPDPNPANPISASICGVQSLSLTAPATGNGTLAYRWETCTDYSSGTGIGSWVSASGTNTANSYSVTTSGTTTGATTFYRLKAVGGCDGLPYYSRIFSIIETPTPSILVDLAGPSTVCSRNPITMTISYVNGTLTWEQSIGGAPWTAASSVPTLTSQVGNNYTFTVSAPTITGDYSQTINYRVHLTSTGCGDIVSTLPQTISVNPEVFFGASTINGAAATSASLCPTDAGVLSTNVTGGNGYQWYTRPVGSSSWTVVPGGTAAQLTITAPNQTVVTSDQYFLRVFGVCSTGSDSAIFTLTFKAGAQITAQPSVPAQTCSGTMQALSFTSAGATAYSWIETSSDGSPTITLPASASITVPALSSGAALNPDPSFETGVDNIQRIAGATGSSVAWDRTTSAYLGSSSVHTYGGSITLQHPSGSALIPVDPALPYMVITGAYSSANLTGSLGVIAYDSNNVQISQTWLTGATAVSLGTTWAPFGAFLNSGAGTTPLPANAAFVKLLVRLNEGGVSEEGHMDDLRIIPLGGDELSIMQNNVPNGTTMAAFWDGRAGKDASGTITRSFSYVGTALSACGAVQTNTVTVASVPKPFISQQPQDLVVCGGQSSTFSASINGGGNISYTWQRSDDGITWIALTGANSNSFFYTSPVVSTTTTFKLRLVGISTCGTVVTRVASVTVNPAPLVQQDLQLQAVACSGDVVPVKFSGVGSNPTWEASQDGGAWTATTLALQADGSYLWTLPQVVGSQSSSLSLRATLSSPYGCQAVVSSTRSITIRPQVLIQTQPQGLTECLTSPSGSLAVAASGSTLTYQWQVNTGSGWSPIPGATTYSYTPQPPNNFTVDYSATYRVLVAGDCGGSQISTAVPVVMYAPPVISTQPQGASLASGGGTTFSVLATGTGLTYQWQNSADGGTYQNISGATGATYATGALTAPTGTSPMTQYYRVVISGPANACTSVISNSALVTVYPALAATPTINTTLPACSGATVSLSTNITSGASTSVRWQVLNGSWQDIPGATSAFYSPSQTATGSTPATTSYRAVVTDVVGQQLNSSPLVITWNPATIITTQPKNVSIATGQTATMSVVATGVGLTYAWDQSADGLSWSQIVGATSSSYTASGPSLVAPNGVAATNFYFRVRVSGSSCDPVSSSMAQVTVYPVLAAAPTFDHAMPVCSGTSVGMNANVTSGASLSIKWQIFQGGIWTDMPGANSSFTSASQTVTGSAPVSMMYRVLLTDPVGQTWTGQTMTGTWNPAPVISTQPKSVSIATGQAATMSVVATGTGLTYAWDQSADGQAWSQISGASGSSYTASSLVAPNGTTPTVFYFRVRVSGSSCDPVLSSTAQVTVYPALAATPTINTIIPACSGTSASLNANLTSGASTSIRWQVLNGTWQDIPGATGGLYSASQSATGATAVSFSYRAVVTDLVGQELTSSPLVVTWNPATIITTQPKNVSIATGQSATMSVVATGVGLTYAWDQSADGLAWSQVAGASSPSYTASSLVAPNGTAPTVFYFRVRVSGSSCDPVSSSTVQVTVYPALAATPTINTILPACSGASVSLSSNLTSGASTSTRWQVLSTSWQDIPGATGGLYSASQAATGTTAVSFSYRAVVTDLVGQEFTSSPLVVTWNPATIITTQPKNVSIATGQSAAMSVVATGVGLTYAWDQSTDGISWSQIAGATNASYTASALVAPNGTTSTVFYFRVRVNGSSCDPVPSSMAQVTVYPALAAAPTFDHAMPVCSGTSVGMNANVTSGAILNIKWQVNQAGTWTDIPGAVSGFYPVSQSVTGSTPTSVQYRVFLTDPVGQTWPGPTMTGTWNPSTAIVTQPQGSTVCQGSSPTLSVAFTGVPGLLLQWQSSTDGLGWSDMPGANATTLTLTNLTSTAQYRARIYGGGCQDVFSSAAQVFVNPKVTITVQPTAATICSGDSATMAVQATGTTLVYRWERLNGSTWQLITNGPSASASVPLTNLGSTDTQVSFRVTVSGDCGTPVVSQTAVITVKPGINIQTQPVSNVTICNNGSTTLFFAGSGFAAIDWQTSADGGSTWGSAGSATTSVTTGPLVTGIYLYRAQIVDLCGNVHFTNIAQVEARATARVTSQPQSVIVCSGQAATFSVAANVTDASYQWYTSNAPDGSWGAISGANTAQLTQSNLYNITGVPTMSYYRVVVTPVACDQPITSAIVSLTIRPGTAVLVQPTPVDTCLNSSATTTVSVTGEQTSVTWQTSTDGTVWTLISGANSPTLQVPTSQIGVWQVRAITVGGCGTIISSPVQVKVSGPTTIQSHPQATTSCQGASVTFAVQASGAALSYQWQRSDDGGQAWSAVGSSLPTLSVIASKNAMFRVIVYGGGGCSDQVISTTAELTVTALPQDVPLEAPIYASAGRQVWLQVASSGPTYDTVTWTMGAQVATGPSAVLQAPATPGTYNVIVTATKNGCQSVTSWNLDVANRGNGDGTQDGAIDGRDFTRFEAAFGTKAGERGFDAVFDLNGNGVIDQADEDLFWAAYGAAAPQAAMVVPGGSLSAHYGQYPPEAVESDEPRRRMNSAALRPAGRVA